MKNSIDTIGNRLRHHLPLLVHLVVFIIRNFPPMGFHVKILGPRKVRWSKFHPANTQIWYLGARIQNSVVRATCRMEFLLPCWRRAFRCCEVKMTVVQYLSWRQCHA